MHCLIYYSRKDYIIMKNIVLSGCALIVILLMSGCNSGIGVANGYGFTAPGIIFSSGVQGGTSEPNLEIMKRPYKHLGRVSGEATQTNVLLIVTVGDASIEAAQADALAKVKNADALINRNFDIKHNSILSLFTTATLRVTGDAIQYTDKQ